MIRQAILKTLAYSDHYNFPLSLNELHLRLHSSKPCSEVRVFQTLKTLIANNLVSQTDRFFHLPGRKKLVAQRTKRAQISSLQLTRAESLARQIGHIPGVLAIYLTGSLAMQNSTLESDIDFMVITQPDQLWTTRFLLTLATSLMGLRRTPNSVKYAGQLCLNLYLTPNSYQLPESKRNLYSAYELIQAVPLYDPQDTHSQLLAANSWINNYLPNFPLPKGRLLDFPSRTLPAPRSDLLIRRAQRVFSRALARPGQTLLELTELVLYHLQLSYMRSKLTREYITPDSAFFHPHDPSPKL